MVKFTMNAKIMIAIVATFAMLFAGVAVADSADADDAPFDGTGVVQYKVGDKVYQVPFKDSNIKLATLADLGAKAPANTDFVAWKNAESQYQEDSTFIPTESVVVFTAIFKATTYTATFVSFDGKTLDTVSGALVSVDAMTGAITNADPIVLDDELDANTAREGYIFIGWLAEGATDKVTTLGNLKADVKYTAQYMLDYVIMFVDGDKTNTMKVSTVTLPAEVTREGYTFDGWYIGSEKIADPVTYSKTVTADTTFTAKWNPVILTVTFVAGDTVLATQPVQYGQTVNEPVVDFPDGYFGFAFDFNTPITADTTISAMVYVPEPVFDVVFNVDGEVYATTDSDEMVIPVDPVKENSKFLGWAIDGELVDVADLDVTADVTLDAMFKAVYTLTFVVDQTTLPGTDSELMQIPADPVKTGYKFAGWSVDGKIVNFDTLTLDKNTTFVAVFEPYTFTVTFVDGEKIVTTQTVKYGDKAIIPATEFIGWQTKAVEVVPGETENAEPTENVTYTDYDFATPVTADVVLYGVKYVAEPSGLDDPINATIAIIAGIVILIIGAVFVSKIKSGEFVIGRGPNAKKNKNKDDDNDEGTE